MDSVSARLSPGGSTGNYQFRGSFNFECATSIGFAILNFRFVGFQLDSLATSCFTFQDWLFLPSRQKRSAHKYPCFRETGAICIARGGCVTPFPGLVCRSSREGAIFIRRSDQLGCDGAGQDRLLPEIIFSMARLHEFN
jgi:hypothetical protein